MQKVVVISNQGMSAEDVLEMRDITLRRNFLRQHFRPWLHRGHTLMCSLLRRSLCMAFQLGLVH